MTNSKKPCPFCGSECEPVTDEFDNPHRISGRGTVYFCEGCRIHWDSKTPKSGRRFLNEEQPEFKGVIEP